MTMARMDRLFGVTMAERGVSQLVSVDLQQADELRVDGVKSSRHLRYLAAASCRLTGLGLNLKVPPPCGSGMMTFAAGPPDLRDR